MQIHYQQCKQRIQRERLLHILFNIRELCILQSKIRIFGGNLNTLKFSSLEYILIIKKISIQSGQIIEAETPKMHSLNYNYTHWIDPSQQLYQQKVSIFNTMQLQSNFKNPIPHSHSIALTNAQPSINLFILESEQTQPAYIEPTLAQKSKSFRRFTKKKTPTQLLTQNILRNRQSSRLKNLREITTQNIKLYLRLQKQQSTYNFKQIHREQSVALLPKHAADQSSRESRTIKSRCSSAGLRIRCESLKNSLSSSNCTANNSHGLGSASRKIILITSRQDKENIGSNKIIANRQLNPVEEKLISNKLGLKLPQSNSNLPISIPNKSQGSKIVKNRPQTCFHQRQAPTQPIILTQRKTDHNIPKI